MFCRHMRACLAAACFVVFLSSCRFEAETTQWVETHGEWQFQSLAAWPEGAWASGLDDRVFRYPGGWGEPWNRPLPVTGKLVAASPNAAFVVGGDNVLRRVQGSEVFVFPNSDTWHISAMAAGEDGSLFVVSNGRVKKVAETLEPVACEEEALAVAVGHESVFVVAKTGQLLEQRSNGCATVALPEGHLALHVAAFGDRLAVVDRQGRGFLRNHRGDSWIALPRPRVYRSAEPVRSRPLRMMSVSALYTWGLDTAGHAFLLSEAQ